MPYLLVTFVISEVPPMFRPASNEMPIGYLIIGLLASLLTDRLLVYDFEAPDNLLIGLIALLSGLSIAFILLLLVSASET